MDWKFGKIVERSVMVVSFVWETKEKGGRMKGRIRQEELSVYNKNIIGWKWNSTTETTKEWLRG
jgi:hypothetical protein